MKAIPNIVFEPFGHRYLVDGTPYPSVTQILRDNGGSNVAQWASDSDRERGEMVHLLTEHIDAGTWDPDSTSTILIPYGRAYEKFLDKEGFRPEHHELKVCSVRYKVAGRLDRWGLCRGEKWLVDLKSGTALPDEGHLQTALYAVMAEEMFGLTSDRRVVVRLGPDGEYKMKFGQSSDRGIALACATWWWWRKNHNRLPKTEDGKEYTV